MSSFDKWRREVNIILNHTMGFSLTDVKQSIKDDVKDMHENGEDPVDAAQYVAETVNPNIDIDQMLKKRISIKSKNIKKFKENEDE